MRRFNHIWEPYTLKSGKLSTRSGLWKLCPYTPLNQCEHCGRLGHYGVVKKWWQRRWRFDPLDDPEPMLCIGCLNRFRPIWRALNLANELRCAANRLKREIADARRYQDRWGSEKRPL